MKTRAAAVTVAAMLTVEPIRSVHFVGVCGTAMAAVAAQLQQRGLRVTGSDENVYPPMSTFLAGQGHRGPFGPDHVIRQHCTVLHKVLQHFPS